MKGVEFTDDRGRHHLVPHPLLRIVSLVPSDTYTLCKLGGASRLVARTKYCVEPEGDVAGVEEVGGTKDPDVERIVKLAPHVVLMNREENTEPVLERLERARVRVFVTFPRRFADGVAMVARIAQLLGDPTDAIKATVRETYRIKRQIEGEAPTPRLRVFVPIWMDPLMTIHGDTFISSVLDALGADNVFADRRRVFPLKADLGEGPALEGPRVAGKDTRYPRVTMAEVEARAPDVILLPSEPHAFTEADREAFLKTNTPAARAGRVHLCDGRDLMWPGLRSLEGLDRLRALLRPPTVTA